MLMDVFKTDPGGFTAIRKQTLLRTVPVMIIGAIVVLVANFNSANNQLDIYTLLITITVMAAAVGRGIYIGLKKRRQLFDSFTIEINEDTVVRTQADTPELALNRLEISSISKDSSGSITIQGMDKEDVILIPAGMERPEELEAALARIITFSEDNQRSLMDRFGWLAGIVSVLLMIIIRLAENKIIILLSGLSLIALLTRTFLKGYRNKNVPVRYKRSSWILLILIAAAVMLIIVKMGWAGALGRLFQ